MADQITLRSESGALPPEDGPSDPRLGSEDKAIEEAAPRRWAELDEQFRDLSDEFTFHPDPPSDPDYPVGDPGEPSPYEDGNNDDAGDIILWDIVEGPAPVLADTDAILG